MDLKEQIIKEYPEQGFGYRKLQSKYGISRTTLFQATPLLLPCSIAWDVAISKRPARWPHLY